MQLLHRPGHDICQGPQRGLGPSDHRRGLQQVEALGVETGQPPGKSVAGAPGDLEHFQL